MKTCLKYLLAVLWLINLPAVLAVPPGNTETLRYFQAKPLASAIELSWPAPVQKISALRIYRQLSSQTQDGQPAALLKQLDGNSRQYIDRDIQEDKVYVYYLTLLDEKGKEGEKSVLRVARSQDMTAPARPEHLQVKVSDDRFGIHFRLSWQKVADKDVTAYRIYRGIEGIQSPVSIAILQADKKPLAYEDDIQKNNVQNWLYAVAAVDSAGNESPLAGPVLIRSPDHRAPAAPLISLLKATPEGIQIQWKAPSDTDLFDYRIYRRADAQPWKILASVPATQSRYLDGKALSGHNYQYAISARDRDKNEGPRSPARRQISLQANVYPAPRGLRFYRNKAGQWELAWKSVKHSGLLGYFIYRQVAASKAFIKVSPLLQDNHFAVPRVKSKEPPQYRLVALYEQGRQSIPVDIALPVLKTGRYQK